MADFLNNPWVIGIGGGIISYLIVAGIAKLFFSDHGRKEYLRNVYNANREVIFAVRPNISEGYIPTAGMIDSLIASTAEKYKVDKKDLYGPPQIADNLTKEVMDSSFISSKTKHELCGLIERLKRDSQEHSVDLKQSSEASYYSNVKQTSLSMMSSMIASMAGITTTAMMYFFSYKDQGISYLSKTKDLSLVFLLILLSVLIVTTLSVLQLRLLKNNKFKDKVFREIMTEDRWNNKKERQ